MHFPIDADTEISEMERSGITIDKEIGGLIRVVLDFLNESYEAGFTGGSNSAYYPICIEKEIKKAREDFPETLDENLSRRILELQNKAYFAGCERRKEKTA